MHELQPLNLVRPQALNFENEKATRQQGGLFFKGE